MAPGPLELVRLAADYLGNKGIESPRLEAELLLAHALGVPRIQLYLQFERPLESAEVDAYREFLRRRARREPAAYVTGSKEFWSLSLRVDARVLIPRPETERLVEAVLHRTPTSTGDHGSYRFLDLGVGSGALALALLHERPAWSAVGVDASTGALDLAGENAERLGVSGRLDLRRGDLYGPVAGETFDLIVSNPPYVPTEEIPKLEPEVCRYEPREALDGGPDGLDALRAVAAGAPRHLGSGGMLAVEFGVGQSGSVEECLGAAGFDRVEILADYAGTPRVALARKP